MSKTKIEAPEINHGCTKCEVSLVFHATNIVLFLRLQLIVRRKIMSWVNYVGIILVHSNII